MKSQAWVLMTSLIILFSSCTGNHLIKDEAYRHKVDSCFRQVEILAGNRKTELFSVFDRKLSLRQKEALKFLFAYMPLNDLADYDGEFYLTNVDMSLMALDKTPWGKSIPGEVFLHYVLPVRINNENLDSFRIACYDEIMSKVKDKSMIDAALEINHWCHEKVTYQPSDSRTSAPLSTILSARGRCGEESTFTVAALRTAGIPARQVYTPRWAHSDDNHAWVEFWAGGKWYYMGACEPEAIPDRGWFTEPARRAMLVHTKSFGAFSGTENILNRFDKYTEVNNLSKYAVTKRIFVKTTDACGKPVVGASVEYQLYNYAEFYPIATVMTNEDGLSSFETGLGDLLIWGRMNNRFNFRKISVTETDTLVLVLEEKALRNINYDLDLSVPVQREPGAGPPSSLLETNNERVSAENQKREDYIDSWITRKEAIAFAVSLKMDTLAVADIIAKSEGNYKSILSFLKLVPDSLKNRSLSLLNVIADKDLRDTWQDVLSDHLVNTGKEGNSRINDPLFIPCVLNPRISNEILSPWRSYFLKKLPSELVKDAYSDPHLIVSMLDTAILIYNEENYSRTPITPQGTWALRVSDMKSRAICFVAICRTLGIPSRLEPGSNIPQYFAGDSWNDVYFSDQVKPSSIKGFVRFTSSERNPVPEYYIHFSLARFENGRYNTLEYNENTRVSDFKGDLQLTPGQYMLVTGNRLNDSKILASLNFFELEGGEHKTIDIKLRHNISAPEILGKADLLRIISLITGGSEKSSVIAEKGAVLFWIEPDREPAKHILNDLPLLRKELDLWPGTFIFLNISSGEALNLITPEVRAKQPSNSIFADDKELNILRTALGEKLQENLSYPLILMINKKGEIIFRSEGYRIGIGEQILRQVSVN